MSSGTFLVAEDSDALAGCVYIETRGDRSYLGLLSVQPARQGTGLGRRLVAAAEDFARGVGFPGYGSARHQRARRGLLPFYRRMGYVFLRHRTLSR